MYYSTLTLMPNPPPPPAGYEAYDRYNSHRYQPRLTFLSCPLLVDPKVKFMALPSFEEREEEFKAEVVVMRNRFDPDCE
jgi:hypothetical protein